MSDKISSGGSVSGEEREQLQALKPTIGRILKSLWYELFGPTQFSPYRQVWCVSTNLLAAIHQSESRHVR